MLAPVSWLKDFVDINVSPETLAKKLVAIGFEVEDIHYQSRQAKKVVTGKILSVEKHPSADRLRVAQVDVGNGVIQVVTNVAVEGGEYVAVALDGAVLYGGATIKRGELRGVPSEGMLCGLEEVGVEADAVEGQTKGDILRFPEGTALGQNALVALGCDDVVLDVAVTANRPDCNSIYRLAKEVAVALGKDCREPHIAYGRRQTDASGYTPDQPREPYKLTDYLIAAVGAGERVNFVDDYESEVAEQTYYVVRAIHEQTFERLGRNLQYAARLAKQLRLVRLRDVAVPVEYRYS